MIENQMVVFAFHKEKGKVIHVKDAENGASCNCICLDCKDSLEAAQGQKNQWHFRHQTIKNCLGGIETTLHKLGKQIICTNNEVIIPGHGKVEYSNPVEEKYFKGFKPDITAEFGGQQFFFEIVVSNPVEEKKAKYYEEERIHSVAIDLSFFIKEPANSYEELEREVIEETNNKEVIFWGPAITTNESAQHPKESTGQNSIIGFILLIISFIGASLLFGNKKARKAHYNKRKKFRY